MPLTLHLLGRFELFSASGAPVEISGARMQLLFALLTLRPDVQHDRSHLSGQFWSDRANEQARASLRQAIWTLRQDLKSVAPSLLRAEGNTLGIEAASVNVDAAEFESKSRAETAQALREALALYRGDLLQDLDLKAMTIDGLFLDLRERLREQALKTAKRLVALEASDGQPDMAIEAARRGLQLDPLQEDLHSAVIVLQRRCGRPTQAQTQYDACRDILRSELGIEPGEETRRALEEPLASQTLLPLRPASDTASPLSFFELPTLGASPGVPWQRLRLPIFAAALVAGLAVAVIVAALRPSTEPKLAAPSVAVFPFADLSVNGQQAEYAEALTSDLITDLTKVAGLFVLAHDSTIALKGGVPAAARELGAEYAVTGSVRRSRRMVRVNVSLIEAANGRHVWAENYDRDIRELFALQDEVVEGIASSLRVRLTDRERKAITRLPTRNLEAYDYYVRAEQQPLDSSEGEHFRRALAAYRRAIELDPTFAEAYAGYARTAVNSWKGGFDNVMPGAIARQAAYNAAGKALTLDPESARAYGVLSNLQAADGEFESAVQSARKAVSLQPSDADARAQLALMLTATGKHQDALAEIDVARRLNPALPPDLLLASGLVDFGAGRYLEAVANLEGARPALQKSEMLLPRLAAAQALTGDVAAARSTVQALKPVFPGVNLEIIAYLNHLHSPEDPLLEGLRLAGVPRWPYGFDGQKEDRIAETELHAFATLSHWIGQLSNGMKFTQEADSKGSFAYRSARSMLTGKMQVRDGMLCQAIDGYLPGREICGFVYRNRDTKKSEPFVFVTIDSVKYFDMETRVVAKETAN